MEIITEINNLKLTNGKYQLVIDINENAFLELSKIRNDKLSIKVEKHRKKRSLDANAYCWVLCDKIAKTLSNESIITKEEVYKDAIEQIGTFEPLIIEEKAYENFKRIWQGQGLGFIVQEVSKQNKCIKLHCYYGSSTYNTKEMSLLINYIVDLAKSLDMETKTENEINSLINSWERHR